MNQNSAIYADVVEYLLKLGYSKDSILFEYETRGRKRVDIVVEFDQKIFIAIEVKDSNRLPLRNLKDVAYDPIARMLQKQAHELGARYFILSNGVKHIWLRTGEEGRPEIIEAISNPYEKSQHEMAVQKILWHIASVSRDSQMDANSRIQLITSILYNELLGEHENVEKSYFEPHMENPASYFFDQKSDYVVIRTREMMQQRGFLLTENKSQVVALIDRLLTENQNWSVPRWLADFMVRLSEPLPNKHYACLMSSYGVFEASVLFNGVKHLDQYYSDPKETFWRRSEQLLWHKSDGDLYLEPNLFEGDFRKDNFQKYDTLLMAPPFNVRIESSLSTSQKNSNSIYINAAMELLKPSGKLILIVPDSFLFSSNLEENRANLLKIGYLESVISLPVKTFYPWAQVKTSILILVNQTQSTERSCFMAALDHTPKNYLQNSKTALLLNKVLSNYQRFLTGRDFKKDRSGFIVPKIDPSNFHFSNYWLKANSQESEWESKGYQLFPLGAVANSIKRGSQLLESKDGELAYIGPGAIREFDIRKEFISATSAEKLPRNVEIAKEGAVLLNGIGSQRGKAALVSADCAGLALNRHVISIIPNENILEPGYLVVAMNSGFVQNQLYDQSTGSVIQSISLRALDSVLVPVPNRKTQIRIAEKFAGVNRQISQTSEKLTQLEASRSGRLLKFWEEVRE